MRKDAPLVYIVLLNYNGRVDTLACLESLARLHFPNVSTVVVDNGSIDNSVAAIRTAHPSLEVLEVGKNLGFCAGNNVGLRYALDQGADYVLLLNNDTEVAPDFLDTLVAAAEADPRIGIAGPTIYYYDSPNTIWSAGGLIDWRCGSSAMRGLGESERQQYRVVEDVDFVTGCALLCKRSALETVGLLDERFFMYFEETELCVRVAKAGFRIVHVPNSHVLHKIPLDARADQPYVTYYMTRNRLLFLRVAGATLSAWLHAALFQDLRTCLSFSVRPKWRGKRPQRDAILRGWLDFCQGRFGALQQARSSWLRVRARH